jgi:P4 family phage/plasmid primase-like protien
VDDRLTEVEFMARKPAPKVADPADEPHPTEVRDPAAYFRDKEAGIDVALLADDVLARGPLRIGRDGMVWRYHGGVWREARDEVRHRVVACLAGRYRGSHATNCEHVVHARVGRINCDPVREFINLRGDADGAGGGMLNWRTGEMLPWSPDYLSTVQLPVAWDPEATCERFESFLHQVLSPEAVELAWEMLGYLMLSGNPLQTAFLFYGTGSNGKGTLMRVITALLGVENCSSVSLDQLNANRFAPAALYGKTANIAGDVDASYQESTAALKSLTGEDVFRGENKHRDGFEFVSWAVPLFSANEVPGSADTSEGYLRRWTVLHFARSFSASERVLGLSDLLEQELPGIAHKAVLALRTLMDRGHFDKSKGDVAAAADEFARKIDQVRQWVEATCITVTSDEVQTDDERASIAANREARTVLFASYKHWHSMNNPGSKCMSAEKFYTRLAAVPGITCGKTQGFRWYAGLRLVEGRMLAPDEGARGLLSVVGDD